MLGAAPNRRGVIAVKKLGSGFLGGSERFEKRIGPHDQLETASPSRMADVEHAVFLKAKLWRASDVNRGFKVRHTRSPSRTEPNRNAREEQQGSTLSSIGTPLTKVNPLHRGEAR